MTENNDVQLKQRVVIYNLVNFLRKWWKITYSVSSCLSFSLDTRHCAHTNVYVVGGLTIWGVDPLQKSAERETLLRL